jgi:FixJ family two-component response regulator
MVQTAPLVAVVDDDPSLRRAVRNLLASAGLRVETFPAAEEFLESPLRPSVSCLVLDLSMPQMNGFELLERLRALGSRLPVIVLTAHSDEEVRRRSFALGASSFLAKPFQAEALIEAVVEHLGQRASVLPDTRPR